MNPRSKNLIVGFALTLLVLGLGFVEGRFGRYDYTGDAISYIDVTKAIRHGDWALALSPYWSVGYPLILAATRWMFPAGPEGEWICLHAVNLAIFLGTYASFLYLLKATIAYTARINGTDDAGPGSGFVFTIGALLFLFWELIADNVSRISPDLLVSCDFFLVMAASLHFYLRPAAKTAVLMGLLMGAGYLIKAIFLPISFCVLAVMFLHALTRKPTERQPAITKLAWAIPALALIAIPYIAAVSETIGSFTLGESGSLNYAWAVNGLASFEHWQGGPAQFGTPIHPTRLVLKNPPVFEFAEPFHVTYPPWFNAYYWYEGYHRFFNLRNQIVALKFNFMRLLEIFFNTPHAPVKAAVAVSFLVASVFLLKDRRIVLKRLIALWPLYLSSLAGVSIYLFVYVEVRYIVAFLIVLLTGPFLALFVPTPLVSRRVGYALVILVSVIGAATLLMGKKDTIQRAMRHETFASTDQWRLGLYLAQSVVHPGEKVASVQVGNHANNGGRTWAVVSEVHIVAEIGNDAYDPADQEKDFALFTSNPDVQQTVFALFRQAGADLVVVRDVTGTLTGTGWEPIPGTQSWFHRL